MQKQPSRPRDGIHVASGYGLKIYVNRGHLVVHEGVGLDRETRRFARATSGLKRLVVIGHTGFMTFEAARWLREIGAVYVQLDTAGRLLLLSGPNGPDQAALRRAQAIAAYDEAGVSAARFILAQKLAG